MTAPKKELNAFIAMGQNLNNDIINIQKIDGVKYVGDYILGKTIGQGSTAKVKVGTHKLTNHKVAVKKMNKANMQIELSKVLREIRIMLKLSHPNVVKLLDVIDTTDHLYLIEEHCGGGELFDLIVTRKVLKERDARAFFRQLISGVGYCHSKGVINRDLKPENLLLDPSMKVLKIIDFGLANICNPLRFEMKTNEQRRDRGDEDSWGFLHTFCGSLNYAAPEMVRGEDSYLGPPVDVWSMGVILYAMVCGKLPFGGRNNGQVYEAICTATYPAPRNVSQECADLITKMLVVDPLKRLTLEDLRHNQWVNIDYNTPPLYFIETSELPPAVTTPAPTNSPSPKPSKPPVNTPVSPQVNNISNSPASRRSGEIVGSRPTSNLFIISEDDAPEGDANDKAPRKSRLATTVVVNQEDSPKPAEKKPGRKIRSLDPTTSITPVNGEEDVTRSPVPATISDATSDQEEDKPKKKLFRFPTLKKSKDKKDKKDKSKDKTKKPRTAKGSFDATTTSTKPPEQMAEQLEKALHDTNVIYLRDGYVFKKCKSPDEKIKLEIEVCHVLNTQLHGLKFKRLKGDTFLYKELCVHIISKLKL